MKGLTQHEEINAPADECLAFPSGSTGISEYL